MERFEFDREANDLLGPYTRIETHIHTLNTNKYACRLRHWNMKKTIWFDL